MANKQAVAYFNGHLVKKTPEQITDNKTGEITKFIKYIFCFDCYIQELEAVYDSTKLPATAEIHEAWIPESDIRQHGVLSTLKENIRAQFVTVPGAKGRDKRGASGLKLRFLSFKPI